MPTDWAAMPMRPPSRLASAILIALAFLAETVVRRQAHILEHDLAGVGGVLAELVLDARDDVARRVGRHDEGARCPSCRRPDR